MIHVNLKRVQKYLINRSLIKLSLLAFIAFQLSSCQSKKFSEVARIIASDSLNPWTSLEWNNEPANFQFVIVTDRTGGMRPGVFEQGVEKVNLLQPEFVMSVGDLIPGYTEDKEKIKQQWDEFDEFVNRLNMPFFYVVGNHDISNQVMEDVWKERLGATYYHFVYRNVLFLCLNSEEGLDAHRSSYFSEKQREYVRKALAENPDVRWTLAFLHKPVWLSEGHEVDSTGSEKVSGWGEIEAMLKGRKHTVYAGHIHRYTHSTYEDHDYITLATTGGGSALRGPVFGQFDHVMWVTMTDDGPIMANLMLSGIWDKDFDRGDIEEYLKMDLQNKVIRIESELDGKEAPKSQPLELRLFNSHEVPMKISVSFENNDHFSFRPAQIEQVVSPNSLEQVKVQLMVQTKPGEDAEQEQLWRELDRLPARWEVTYDFEKYGEIRVKGSRDIY